MIPGHDERMDRSPQQHRPFSHYLLISMILLILLIATGITVVDYLQARADYERNAALLQTQTEENIVQTIRIIDAGFRLFDDSQNEKMIDGFTVFMEEYRLAGRNPAAMDLARVKKRIGGNVDLYIINESGIIEYTTYPPELGLDFGEIPYFYDYLTRVRLSEGYFSDRVVNELTTGKLRKYAYMPTDDHKYVFEIGLTGPLYGEQHTFGMYQENMDQIVALNPYIRDIAIYDVTRRPVNLSAGFPDSATNASLDQVIAQRRGMEIISPDRTSRTAYLFVDLYDPGYGSDVSRIVRITYDISLIEKRLNDLLLAHLLTGLVAVLLGVIVAILLSRFLSAPVSTIVSDVNRIAQGDLAHPMSPVTGAEFAAISESVSTMVQTLNETIRREKESEERFRMLIENIPDVVWTTTEEGRTVFISKNVGRVYGYTPEEVYAAGQALFFDRIHPDDIAMVRAEFSSLFRKKMIDIEYRIQRKDGRWIWLHDRSTSVYEIDGVLFADGIFSDITDRKQAEERVRQFSTELEGRVAQRTAELQKTEEAFRAANKKLNLLSSITRHDILNQLTIMTGYLKLASDQTNDENTRQYLLTAQKAAEVIDRHMLFTRLYQNVGVQAPAWQNVRQILDKIRKDFPRERILLSVETGDLELFADPLLEKVFFTLLENTIRHGNGATVAQVSFALSDTGLTLIYTDNGPGVGPHEKERIFEWGYGKHTGFGLFLSREILAITGLAIRETGEAGKGVRFEILIPHNAFRFFAGREG